MAKLFPNSRFAAYPMVRNIIIRLLLLYGYCHYTVIVIIWLLSLYGYCYYTVISIIFSLFTSYFLFPFLFSLFSSLSTHLLHSSLPLSTSHRSYRYFTLLLFTPILLFFFTLHLNFSLSFSHTSLLFHPYSRFSSFLF
jgi:hypothetical protein